MANPTIYKIISGSRDKMSKSQHKIADYILENPHSIPFITGAKLAKMTGVSEATVVRFATFLGYSGYNDLQKQLASSIEKQLNTVERLNMSHSFYSETEKAIYDNFNEDIKNIQTTMQHLNVEDFERAANYILDAERIYIIANRSALSLGTFLQYYINIIFGKSELVHTTEAAFDQIHHVNENDVVIGISYARYTKSTLDVVSYAAEKKATIIALTDHFSSPITAYANIALFASSNMKSFLDSFVAPLSVINTLIAYIGNVERINMKERLENFEQLWDRYDVFYKNNEEN
ncbi:MurR/RpiR family transcriptional regulator [Pseudogracilibacillus auburnensis]|uniref:MurR/RpiR family transcriptional regulator n=1 Tax=Pseudogracilibacillus auburnensis TaxID=1494959 RepID=UPI001A97B7FB|nr:MurR/RpiR family transcriptional regulator [Pseudogracilibacillus auburnensis]MBO1002879.1 MurR/RpiR family transcriptional regulator [Pseudogracilibacillus auburnensis]